MKAARWHGREDIRIEDVPEPEVRPGTVKVAVDWCGICGTDLHEYLEGPIFIPPEGEAHPITGEEAPIVMGHEFAGTVAEIGDGVKGIEVGDAVVVEPIHCCDTCAACLAGQYNTCEKLGFVGLSGGGGGFAEYVVVDARWIHQLGDVPTDVGALIEPLAVGYHAVELADVEAGQTAVVFGSGPIGLVTIGCLKARDVRVICVEPADARKDKATTAGADHLVDPTDTDVLTAIAELTEGVGADVAFECAGIDEVLNQAVACVKSRGRVVNVAIWGHPATVDMMPLTLNEVDVVGSIGYCGDHEATIAMVADGAIDTGALITGRIGLDELVDVGFRQLIDNKAENVKILVHP